MANTTVKVFSSTDPGAPVLSGTAGALLTLLKICLVDGRGLTSVVGLSVASGIATATYSAGHPFAVGSVGLFAGAAPAALNGEQRILTTSTNTITFAAPGVADGAATGTITSKLAPAGWQQVFSGTNLSALKPLAVEASGSVLRVDDTGAMTARVRANESMTDISTGTGAAPRDSQVSGGLYWYKSTQANGTPRPWYLVADAQGFYLAVAPQGADSFSLFYAGDITSLKSGDAYGYLLTGAVADTPNAQAQGCCGYSRRSSEPAGAYMVRAYTGLGQARLVRVIGSHHNGSAGDAYAGAPQYSWGDYPNGPNNGLLTSTVGLFDSTLRGTLPGLLHCVQNVGSAFASGVVVEGTDDYAGHKLMALRVGPPSAASGTVFFDLSDWRR